MPSWLHSRARRRAPARGGAGSSQHGRVTNYWGGSSNATTHLLELMHFRGLLRVVRRDAGIRSVRSATRLRPTSRTLIRTRNSTPWWTSSSSVRAAAGREPVGAGQAAAIRGTPQWIERIPKALARATHRLARASVEGTRLVLAGRRDARRARSGRPCAAAGAVRPGCLGSQALRIAVGMGLPVRGVHACGQAEARLLRAAAAVARTGGGMGERRDKGRQAYAGTRLRRRPRAQDAVRSGANSTPRSNGCGTSYASEFRTQNCT